MIYRHLLSPAALGDLKLKNRVFMAPMVRNYAEPDGRANARYVAHVESIAHGGVGALILEASYVSLEGKGFVNELGLHDDAMIAPFRKVTAAAHRHGAMVGVQLYHAGRQTSQKTTGVRPIAPSAVPDPTVNEIPEAMDTARIKAVVEAFGRAAKRAKDAGCDFVELHAAHGYLITQFLSSFSNRRTDKYGGDFESRSRFLREVYAAVRSAVGPKFVVTARISGDEEIPGGITTDEAVRTAQLLESLGAAAVHVSVGNYATYAKGHLIPPMAVPDAPLLPLAKTIKAAIGIPVIAVAKIRLPGLAEKILADGDADFIALGRPLLADPDWVNKAQTGRQKEIMPCIACNQGCISRLFAQQDVWCTVNPETGREREFAKKKGKRKTVVIAGGGPAGMSAAKTAAKRGHKVILYEKSSKLGGQLSAAEAAPHREGWRELRLALERDVRALGVDVRLRTACTAEAVKKDKADAVIVAIGSTAMTPKIPGVGRTNVMTSRDVLEGRSKPQGSVVVVGGGCSGAQTAEYLADRGHSVAIVEATGEVAIDAPVDERALLLGRLEDRKVKIHTRTHALSIGDKGVAAEDRDGAKLIPADTVVICLGSFPNDGVIAELKGVAKDVRLVGDAVEARRVTDAVKEGALAALAL